MKLFTAREKATNTRMTTAIIYKYHLYLFMTGFEMPYSIGNAIALNKEIAPLTSALNRLIPNPTLILFLTPFFPFPESKNNIFLNIAPNKYISFAY